MKYKLLKYDEIENKKEIFLNVLFFVFGFIVSLGKVGGFVAPFSIAFAMALRKKYSIFCFLGGIFSITLFLTSENLIYFFILVLGFCFKIFFNPTSSFKNAIFCAISFIVPNLFFILLFPIGFKTLMLIYFQTVLCSVVAALCTQNSKDFNLNFSIFNLTNKTEDFLKIFAIISVTLVSLCSFNILNFNFGRFVASFFAIEFFLIYGFNYSAIFGVVATISFALFDKDFAKYGVILAISSFFSGLFKNSSKFFQLALFMLTYFFSCLFFGGFSLQCLFEIFFASILSLLVPNKYFGKSIKNHIKNNNLENFNLNDRFSLKLKFASELLQDLRENVKKCSKVMDSADYYNNYNNIFENVSSVVCKNCGLNNFCWVKSYSEISRAFCDASRILKKTGSLDEENIPLFLKKKCCKISDLIKYLNYSYKEFVCLEQNNRRINEARGIISEQFLGMAEFLMDISKDFKTIKNIDSETSQIILKSLKKEEFEVETVYCVLDETEKISVDVYFKSILKKEDVEQVNFTINKILGKEMSHSSFLKAGKGYKISFFEAFKHKIKFAIEQMAAEGNSYCGDSYNSFIDSKGFFHVILSDGMGSGKRAFLDSLMTCLTLRRFIELGFGFGSALKILNLSFSIKSKEETFSTVDCCAVNLYSGCAIFKKAGATASYIKRKGEEGVIKIMSKSLPIGIVRGVGFDCEQINLFKGDVVVMVSDGATTSGFEWIGEELEMLEKKPPKYIARAILEMAKQKEDKKHSDDITVIAFRV